LGGYGSAAAKKVYNVSIDENLFYLTENVDACVEINGVYGFTINNNNYIFTSTGVGQVALVRSGVSNGSISHNSVVTYNSDTTKPTLSLVAFSNQEYQDNIVIEGNTFYVDNAASTDLIKAQKGSRRIIIRDNVFFGNTTTIARAMGVGECSDVDIVGNKFINCTIGIVLSEGTYPSTTRVNIKDNCFEDCGSSGGAHISTTGGTIAVTYLHVTGNTSTNTKSTAGGAVFASLALSASTGNIFKDNNIYGGLTVFNATTPWSLIEQHIGYNPVGISTITVTASPFTYTAGLTHETVYIYDGTVSNITVGGTSTAVASPSQVQLPPGIAVVVTYTVAPTMVKYIH